MPLAPEKPPAKWRNPPADWIPSGQTLQRLRERFLKLTTEELASAWGVSLRWIQACEKRRRWPIPPGVVRQLTVATCRELANRD